MLKEINCYRMSFGVECGNEEFRVKKLLRTVANKKLIKKFEILAEGDIPWAQAGLTSPQVAAMLGDAVSINVLGPVIAEALYSSGLVKDKPKFPRDRAAVSASSSSSLT